VAVALGGLGVGVAGKVGDLGEVAELVGRHGDEGVAKLVGCQVLTRKPCAIE
jgi:hypothetical protein